RGRRQRVDVLEVAFLGQVGAQAAVELVDDFLRLTLQLFGAVFRQLGDGGLGGVPIARAVLVEVGGGASEPSQGICEDLGGFAGHDAAELHAALLEAAVAGLGERR